MSYGERLMMTGLSSLVRGGQEATTLFSFLGRGSGERGACVTERSLVNDDRIWGNSTKLNQGRSRLDMRKKILLRRWSNTGTEFLDIWLCPMPVSAQETFEQCPHEHGLTFG